MCNELPNYEEKFLEQCRINHGLVVSQVLQKDEGMVKKIITYCNKSGYDYDDVVRKIKEDKMFAFHFAKDPGKQNIFENLAGEYIEGIEFISNYRKLPSSGKKAKYIIEGSILDVVAKENAKATSETKSIDFYWEYNNKEFYALHKYTREGGGAQDNQYTDAKLFIKHANKSISPRRYFLAIVDGDYYDTWDSEAKSSKIENLKKESDKGNRVYALRIGELYELLKNICGL